MSHVRFGIVGIVGVLFAVLLSGCATVGEIPVDIGDGEPIYISPANGDGVQDSVTFPLSITPLQRTLLKQYSVMVINTAGITVRSTEEVVSKTGLINRNRRVAVDPPEFLLWDGRNDAGEFVPDGDYTLVVTVMDNKGNTGVGPDQPIIVDNTPPKAEISVSFALFTPNGDGILDTLSIYQRRATQEDSWVGSIRGAGGARTREFTWVGAPADIVWDGTTASGAAAAQGTYEYRLSATDRAGNSVLYTIPGIALENEPRSVSIRTDRRVFSPNGDGNADTIVLTPVAATTQNLQNWTLQIRDIRGDAVRTHTGTTLPRILVFDGKSDAGNVLPDGQYRAVLSLAFTGGQRPETASPVLTVDNRVPLATVAVSRTVFSPDGDGKADTVEVLQGGSIEDTWTGTLSDSTGTVVRSQQWSGRLGAFEWDGTDATGKILPDGPYTYSLVSTDAAGNTGMSRSVRVILDSRPTPVRIQTAAQRFSPNGDGLQDTVSLTMSATVPEGISEWTVQVLSPGGATRGIIATGRGELPAEVQWDGSVDGSRLPDADYVVELVAIYAKGNESSALSRVIRLDTTSPAVSVQFAPALFSPDNDGTDDQLTITLSVRDQSPIQRWEAILLDPQGNEFIRWNGTGAPVTPIRWDGKSRTGELVQAAEDYVLTVRAVDAVRNEGTAETVIPIDILVIREGNRLRIQISSIYFVPYTADYINLDEEKATRNLQTLDRLAQVLTKYPQHSISVDGYAVSVLWYDATRAAREQREVLLPLSLARANAIKAALVARGLSEARMTTAGYGGLYPVVPHSDEENRWKNRRVEFILERK